MRKGSHHTEEHRRKMSERMKGNTHTLGYHHTENTRKRISTQMKKVCEDPELRKKRSTQMKKVCEDPETRKKMSERMKGNTRALGYHPPQHIRKEMSDRQKKRCEDLELRKKIGEAHKGNTYNLGRHPSGETRNKMCEAHKGEKSPMWKGGISFEPYCPKFNNEFKERNRAFFDYICPECLTPQNGVKLCVHHINFNKMSCCDNTPPLFVPLCKSCHSKTNSNRDYWEAYFTNMIEDYYEGKCYFTPEEMACRS